MNKFKHSGTLGDIVYALPLVKHLGGGEFYLHMNQIDWVGAHYYGSKPNPFHQGRMNDRDFEFMKSFFLAQDYITRFEKLDPSTTEITHNLDQFRVPFVGHPGNYVDIYCSVFGITDFVQRTVIRTTPWLTVPQVTKVEGKRWVINRTERWVSADRNPNWDNLKNQGVDREGVFVGLPEEHRAFEQATGWRIDYLPTKDMLELAQVIAGADTFIGNQSVALSIAIGLGVPYGCEARSDLPPERNECYFPNQYASVYF
jgi:hypothetical protein